MGLAWLLRRPGLIKAVKRKRKIDSIYNYSVLTYAMSAPSASKGKTLPL
jgi:hypothetical protein